MIPMVYKCKKCKKEFMTYNITKKYCSSDCRNKKNTLKIWGERLNYKKR